MATYEKIDANTFQEVRRTTKRITLQELQTRKQELIAAYQAMERPTVQELADFARNLHPYFVEREKMREEYEALQELIDYLKTL